jgi:hypothetical protein
MINDENKQQVPSFANRAQQFDKGLVHGQVAPPPSLQRRLPA